MGLVSKALLVIIGVFLALDGFVSHNLVYNYPPSLAFLDSFVSHGVLGLVFVGVAFFEIYKEEN